MEDILRAQEKLVGNTSIVLVKDNISFTSTKHGIKPMLDLIEKNYNLTNFVVADKIVGKGVAMLFLYAGIKAVYAEVISKVALHILEKEHIKVSYSKLVPNIINRQGTDLCPMEKAVLNIDNIQEAYQILKAKSKELMQSGGK